MANSDVIGLMSGTSLDGLDIVYTKWYGDNQFEIVKSNTIAYNAYWLDQLKNISSYKKDDKELKLLDVALGKFFGEQIVDFIQKNNITHVDFIASHGHTVHHQPEIGYTLQIGCGKEIYKKTGIKTVYDFRTQDVAYGGQGAPLVPIGDQLLFSEYDYCLNLGGFSNVSFNDAGIRKAFDICPVNTVLNFYANKLGYEYDAEGVLSKKGIINEQLLLALNSLSFYKTEIPKSLGVEFLRREVYPLINEFDISEIDVMRTFVEHIACQLVKVLVQGSVLVTGGGAYHTFLIDRVKSLNPNLKIVIPSAELVEYKEALVFALLGKLRVENKVNCLSSVTGATKNHSAGQVCQRG